MREHVDVAHLMDVPRRGLERRVGRDPDHHPLLVLCHLLDLRAPAARNRPPGHQAAPRIAGDDPGPAPAAGGDQQVIAVDQGARQSWPGRPGPLAGELVLCAYLLPTGRKREA